LGFPKARHDGRTSRAIWEESETWRKRAIEEFRGLPPGDIERGVSQLSASWFPRSVSYTALEQRDRRLAAMQRHRRFAGIRRLLDRWATRAEAVRRKVEPILESCRWLVLSWIEPVLEPLQGIRSRVARWLFRRRRY